MKTTLVIVVLLALLAGVAWWGWNVVSSVGGFNMSAAGWVAMSLGIILTLAVGFGLMYLVFRSSREGQDEPPEVID